MKGNPFVPIFYQAYPPTASPKDHPGTSLGEGVSHPSFRALGKKRVGTLNPTLAAHSNEPGAPL